MPSEHITQWSETRKWIGLDAKCDFYYHDSGDYQCLVKVSFGDVSFWGRGSSEDLEKSFVYAIEDLESSLKYRAEGGVIRFAEKEHNNHLTKLRHEQEVAQEIVNKYLTT